MKKIIVSIIAVFILQIAVAQQGEILYTNCNPDLCVSAEVIPYPNDTINVDFDHDGIIDFKVYLTMTSSVGYIEPELITSWGLLRVHHNNEDDTIVPSGTYRHNITNIPNTLCSSHNEWMIGFKKTVDSLNYYAWVKVYVNRVKYGIHDPNHGVYDKVWGYVDKYACCTIPNYPLHWGQTSLNWPVEGIEDSSFASVCPNPSKGVFTISGENLLRIEVVNLAGQTICSSECDGDGATIDMSCHPAGVYLINITNKNGELHTKKVVKE